MWSALIIRLEFLFGLFSGLESESNLQVRSSKEPDAVMTCLIYSRTLRANLDAVITIRNRLHFEAKNQTFGDAVFYTSDCTYSQTENLSGA